jgi:hypothetical protein
MKAWHVSASAHHGVTGSQGRRGCGIPKSLLKIFGQAHAEDPDIECNASSIGIITAFIRVHSRSSSCPFVVVLFILIHPRLSSFLCAFASLREISPRGSFF